MSLFYYGRVISVLLACACTTEAKSTISHSTWRGLKAFTLSDRRCEVVVVPGLGGRVVSYGLIGGRNFIWSGPAGVEQQPPTLAWGGDKTYIGPHTLWSLTLPSTWPPPSPDAAEHTVEILEDGRLRTTSPPWEGYDGARVVREQGFDDRGDFVITHTITKVPGSRAIGAVWTITQTVPAKAFYVPLNPISPYKDNFFWFGFSQPKQGMGATVLSPSLLELRPKTGQGFKLGAHPVQPALAAVEDDVAFVQLADPQEGQYPEGADNAGLSVEVYHHDAEGTGEYVEMEFLSPLRRLDQGATLTTRWSLHRLPEKWTPNDVEALLRPAPRAVGQ